MNFTREPIVETVITPKEGFKLVLRSSKGTGHEEFFVDAIEVISFGHNCFYRSLEKPKCFIVPVGDYEILEVRETRVVLKTPSLEKGGIKIGGGRESPVKTSKEVKEAEEPAEKVLSEVDAAAVAEHKGEKRRDKRRLRKRRGRDQEQAAGEEGAESVDATFPGEPADETAREHEPPKREERAATLIPPPTTLISETLAKYKDTPGFSGAFFEKKEELLETQLEEENAEESRVLVEEEIEPDFFAEERVERRPEEEDEGL